VDWLLGDQRFLMAVVVVVAAVGFGRGAGPGGGPGGFGMLAINISSFEDRSSRDVRRLQSALMWLSSVD
jgi:hypothetical protein